MRAHVIAAIAACVAGACGRIDFDAQRDGTAQPITTIAWRSTATQIIPSSGNTSITISAPAGVAASDVLIAVLALGNSSSPMMPTFTPTSGWMPIRRTDFQNATTLITYWRVATAAEPASYMWGFDEVIEGVAWISAYTGADTTSPIDVDDGVTIPTGGPEYATPSITTTVANTLVVASFAAHDLTDTSGNTTWSAPAGTMLRAGLNNVSTRSGLGVDVAGGAAGPTDALTATTSVAPQDYGLVSVIALRPAP